MDPDVSRWVAEFLLRSSVPGSLVAKTIAVLPLSSADTRLKKTLLLRTLQSQLSNASITETTLEVLEQISDIDRDDAFPVPESMCRAYCAVAVECTVKYLAARPDDNSKEYLSALRRIWRGRVADVELRRSELLSGEMEQWREVIEAALCDPRVSERLTNLNTRNDAFKEVRLYLKEAWETMGPTFLDKMAAMSNKKKGKKNYNKNKKKMKNLRSLDGDPMWEGCTEGVCGFDTVRERGDREDLVGCSNDPVQAVVVEGRSKPVREHGDNDVDVDDDDVGDDGACRMEGVILNGGNHWKEQWEERVEASFDLNHEPSIALKVSPISIKKDNNQSQCKRPAFRRCYRGVKFSPEELDPEKSWSKDDTVPSAEFRKTQQSLKSSSMELRALVKDPLQDALNISEVARSKLTSKNTNQEPPIGNQSGQRDIQYSNTCRSIVLYQPKDPNLSKLSSPVNGNNVHLEKLSSAHQGNGEVRHPNLMKRNSSARTYEWVDSIYKMPQGMPSRRKKRKWTPLEEETLRNGVKMFGEGNWATIRSFYSNIFDNRSGVDLKDKWRNMIR